MSRLDVAGALRDGLVGELGPLIRALVGWPLDLDALKKELRLIEPQILELEAARDTAPDLDALTDEMLAYMECFDQIAAEGTVEEKRRFARAFVSSVSVGPGSRRGQSQAIVSMACGPA